MELNSSGPAGQRSPASLTRLPSLTGLRFVAALLVFLFHISVSASPIPPSAPLTPFADPHVVHALSFVFTTAGYVGVSFFFVLSGFVLTWSSRPGEPARAFWRRRVLKIYPNHAVMWTLAMIIFAGTITTPATAAANLLLIHPYVPSLNVFFSVNEPSWTLGSEMLFYALFPFLIRLIRRIPDGRLYAWAAAVLACIVAVPLVSAAVIPHAPSFGGSAISLPQFWFGYIFPPMRLFEFVLGVLLARITRAGRQLPVTVPQAAVLVTGAYCASLYVPIPFQFNVITVIPLGLLICAAASADRDGRRSALQARPMQWLGNVSFAFYMCQGVVMFYGRWLLGPRTTFATPVAIAVVAALFTANLLAAWLLYAGVERPVMRRWSRSRRRPVPAAGAAAPPPREPERTPPNPWKTPEEENS